MGNVNPWLKPGAIEDGKPRAVGENAIRFGILDRESNHPADEASPPLLTRRGVVGTHPLPHVVLTGGELLSPKVTNNIAQGKAASAATLGIGQQRIPLPEGEQQMFVAFSDGIVF